MESYQLAPYKTSNGCKVYRPSNYRNYQYIV